MTQRVEVAKVVGGLILLGIHIATLLGKREHGDPLAKGVRWNVDLGAALFMVAALAAPVLASESCTVIGSEWTLDIAGALLFGAAMWLGWLAPGEAWPAPPPV